MNKLLGNSLGYECCNFYLILRGTKKLLIFFWVSFLSQYQKKTLKKRNQFTLDAKGELIFSDFFDQQQQLYSAYL